MKCNCIMLAAVALHERGLLARHLRFFRGNTQSLGGGLDGTRAWWGCASGDDAMEYMRGARAGSASSSASSGGAQLGYLSEWHAR